MVKACPFLIVLLHFIAFEVFYISYIYKIKTLHPGLLLCTSFLLHAQWFQTGSLKLAMVGIFISHTCAYSASRHTRAVLPPRLGSVCLARVWTTASEWLRSPWGEADAFYPKVSFSGLTYFQGWGKGNCYGLKASIIPIFWSVDYMWDWK